MIGKSLISILAVFILWTGTLAQQTDSWQKVKPEDGKFSIQFPCKPEVTSENVASGAVAVKQIYYACLASKTYYALSYSDFGPGTVNAKQMLEKFRDGIVVGMGGKLVSEKSIALASYPGLQFQTNLESKGVVILANWQVYLVGRRIYGMGVAGRPADTGSIDEKKFFSSFVPGK